MLEPATGAPLGRRAKRDKAGIIALERASALAQTGTVYAAMPVRQDKSNNRRAHENWQGSSSQGDQSSP